MPDTIPPPAGEESGDDLAVDFERWATASARLLRRSIMDRALVLNESGLSSRWAEIDEHWYETLVQDLDAGRLDRLDRYVEICKEERGYVPKDVDAELASESQPEPSKKNGKPLTSVTPPLGSAPESSESIEVDVLDFGDADADDEDDDDDEPRIDDTRVSATLPED